ADGLVYVPDGDVAVLEMSSGDRAAVEQDPWYVQPDERHRPGGDGLVAADERHHRVKHVAAPDELDRVGNHFTADERRLHALGPHGHAVRNGYGVELHGRAARRAYAFLHLRRQAPEMEVAGHRLNPGVGDANDRPREVIVGESDGLKHRARARARRSF